MLAVKLVGFGEKQVIAHYWGTGATADAYFAVFGIIWTLVYVLRELIQPPFLPVYVGLVESGRRESAYRLFSVLIFGLLLVVTAAAAALAIWPAVVVKMTAPGFAVGAQGQATVFMRAMAVGAGLLSVSGLTQTVLNAHQKFAWAAVGELVFRVIFVGCLAVGLGRVGQGHVGWWLTLGSLAGLCVHAWALRQHVGLRWPIPDEDSLTAMRQAAILAAPLMFGVIFSHVGQLVDTVLASGLAEGRVSALNFGKKLTDAIVLMGPVALGTVMFAKFSSQVAAGKLEEVGPALVRCVRVVLVASVPVALLVVMLRGPIVVLAYHSGKFNAQSAHLTAAALGAYGLGVVALSLEGLLVGTFYALKDMKTPVIVGVAGVTVSVGLAWLLMKRLDHVGIALSVSIVKSAKVVVLLGLLNARLRLGLGKRIGRLIAALIGAGLAGGAAIMVANRIYGGPYLPVGRMASAVTLCILSVAGLSAFALVAGCCGLLRIDASKPDLYIEKRH